MMLRGDRVSGCSQQSIHVSQVRKKVVGHTWWRGGGVSQAEPGTSAKDTWPVEPLCICKYQLTALVDRQ
jgi:hypothetical protein